MRLLVIGSLIAVGVVVLVFLALRFAPHLAMKAMHGEARQQVASHFSSQGMSDTLLAKMIADGTRCDLTLFSKYLGSSHPDEYFPLKNQPPLKAAGMIQADFGHPDAMSVDGVITGGRTVQLPEKNRFSWLYNLGVCEPGRHFIFELVFDKNSYFVGYAVLEVKQLPWEGANQ